MTGDLLGEICRHRNKETHREEGHMMMEAETGVMQLEARKCQGLLTTPLGERHGAILP